MALIEFGSLVTSIKGKIAGHVLSSGQGGNIIKTKTFRAPSRNLNLTNMFNNNKFVANKWTQLTPSERLQWEAYANFAKVPNLRNSSIFLRGRALFMLYNNLRFQINGTTIDTPTFAKGDIPPITFKLKSILGNLSITFSRKIEPTQEMMCLYLSGSLPETWSFRKNQTRLVIFEQLNQDTFTITTPYTDIFGIIPSTGDNIHGMLTLIDLNGSIAYYQASKAIDIVT